MNQDEISQAFSQFNRLNIAVIGDLMLDSYLIGKVDRISPEAPVPVVQVKSVEQPMWHLI
jgi:bifunctional ADP-heptose synthase (sugar kinase/adenylyltransferase)